VQQRLTTADRLLATQPTIRKLRNGAVFAVALGDIAGGAQSFAEIDVGHLCERAVVLSRSTVLRCASVELRLEPWEVIADLRRAGVRDSSAPSSVELHVPPQTNRL
jgi:hypothetical protein